MVCTSPVFAAAATSDVSLTQARVITVSLTGMSLTLVLSLVALMELPRCCLPNVVVNAGSGSVNRAAPASATDGATVVSLLRALTL
jgi:hypothetical protein